MKSPAFKALFQTMFRPSIGLESEFETLTIPSLGPQRRPDAMPIETIEARLGEARSEISPDKLDLVKALALLWHDHLDPAHEIAQNIETQDGSFLHGVMHRREPDYGNAKYWFRRTENHPSFIPLAKSVQEILPPTGSASALALTLLPDGIWSSFGFVDACEQAAWKGQNIAALQEIQRLEFKCFLEEVVMR